AVLLMLPLTPAARPAQAQTAPLYVLPILDGTVDESRVRDVVSRLGPSTSSVTVGFSGVYRYLAETEPPDDRDEDFTLHFMPLLHALQRIADVARATNTPFLVHLNGGRWAGSGPLVDRLSGDPRVMAWDQNDVPWSYPKDGEHFFSLSDYNEL